MTYAVDIALPSGVGFGRSGLRDMSAVLEYVRGALRPGRLEAGTGAVVRIDGPSADAGVYRVGPDRKLYRSRDK